MEPSAMNAVRRVACFAELALFAIVDGQQDKVADFEVLVLHFRSYCSDCSRSFVAEDCRKRADGNLSFLEDEILVKL